MNSTDPFEAYEKQIKELKEQRDNLVDACDGLIDCLSNWVEIADKDADLTHDNAAIEKANEAIEVVNAAIRAAQPEKISLGWPDSQTVTVFLDGKHVATMTNAPGYEDGIPMELFNLMCSAHYLLALAKHSRDVFAQLEDWRDLDATHADSLICSQLFNCDQAIDKAEGR